MGLYCLFRGKDEWNLWGDRYVVVIVYSMSNFCLVVDELVLVSWCVYYDVLFLVNVILKVC